MATRRPLPASRPAAPKPFKAPPPRPVQPMPVARPSGFGKLQGNGAGPVRRPIVPPGLAKPKPFGEMKPGNPRPTGSRGAVTPRLPGAAIKPPRPTGSRGPRPPMGKADLAGIERRARAKGLHPSRADILATARRNRARKPK